MRSRASQAPLPEGGIFLFHFHSRRHSVDSFPPLIEPVCLQDYGRHGRASFSPPDSTSQRFDSNPSRLSRILRTPERTSSRLDPISSRSWRTARRPESTSGRFSPLSSRFEAGPRQLSGTARQSEASPRQLSGSVRRPSPPSDSPPRPPESCLEAPDSCLEASDGRLEVPESCLAGDSDRPDPHSGL